ncbi:purine-nucleoside phosphorylase [Fundidesulfovibrio putealis]|uniref:purine-nucleoside phosphorylase n=1 Tax=Fundidesulfovibrio putealis TaxID=270496 RepID=UPI00048A20AF|nr:purine-nucleoside phosphorylase [Fundidesulfovibrio putealis]
MQDRITTQYAVDWIRDRLPSGFTPKSAIVLGTGLGDVTHALDTVATITYQEIPGFPRSTVEGHAGQLLAGRLAGLPVLVWQGRFHLYEGYSPAQVCLGVRVSALLGATILVVTNAAGALDPLFSPGELLAITDHVNLTGKSSLAGPNIDDWGPRFPDMSRVYSQRLLDLAVSEAMRLGIRLERGVYAGVLGPQLETPAETRMLRLLGADAVGMSTVMEVIAARHMGMEVLGLSCLVNKNLPDCMAEVTLDEVIAVAGVAGKKLSALVEAVAGALAGERADRREE